MDGNPGKNSAHCKRWRMSAQHSQFCGAAGVDGDTNQRSIFWVDSDVIHALHRQQRVAKESERQEGLLTIRPTSGGDALRLQAVSVAQSERSPVGTLSCDTRACSVLLLECKLPAAHSQTRKAAV